MSKKLALGRGLNALLPSGGTDADGNELQTPAFGGAFDDRARLVGRVAEIEIEGIRPNPYQPRRDFDETALEELAASITQLGIIQPLTVRSLGGNRFELIAGERRLRAARRAGLKKVPAYIREADTEAMLEMAIVENVQREDLNPIEVALSYQRLIDECALTQEEVARKVGKNRTTVANMLRLLKLPAKVQAALKDATLTVGHARAILSVEQESTQLALFAEIVDQGLNVRQVEERVRKLGQPQAPTNGSPSTVPGAALSDRDRLEIEALVKRLRNRLSTQVRISHKASGGGRIEIDYYSDDDLERVLELIGLSH
jgi:ParB family transcriptional regulator, chromosome partitioning protein